jgi:hypothetical protein
MAIAHWRPRSKHVHISEIPSKPCIECADCKVGKRNEFTGVLAGACLSANNLQDKKGVIAEIIEDVEQAVGSCKSFRFRTVQTAGEASDNG